MPATNIRNRPSVPSVEEVDESTGADNLTSMQRFENAKQQINSLTQRWEDIDTSIRNQRLLRKLRVDVEALKNRGVMQATDVFIGVRTIDNNVTLSLPPHVAYIKQSPRQAIFTPDGQIVSDDVTKRIESEFTRVMRYPLWEFDYIRLFDASEFLGWGWVEVLYDRKKPGKCAVKHVGTEDLMYDTSVSDIQESRMVLRRYRPTLVTLLELAKVNGFDAKAVKAVKEKLKEVTGPKDPGGSDLNPGSCATLYKMLFKEGGQVFCAWYTNLYPDGWLRDPKLFWNGVKEQSQEMTVDPVSGMQVPIEKWVRTPETDYPYYPMLKKVTEDDEIVQTQGRGEMDQHLQQAATTLWSSFITQAKLAATQMWAPKTPDSTRVGGVAPKQITAKLEQNAIWSEPMESFTPQPPDSNLPIALDKLATQNADNLNQPAWTVNNRQNDSRKTAKEVEVASQQNAAITSTQVVVSSVCICQIQNASWRIVQSQALQGNITFLSQDGTPQGNALDIIGQSWTLKPAGDVDFIERQETEAKMQQDWPLIQATPLAMPFMQDYLRLRYPTRAEGWLAQLQMNSPEKAALAALIPITEQLAYDDNGQPEQEIAPMIDQFEQILAGAKALLQPQQAQQANNVPGNQQATAQPMA